MKKYSSYELISCFMAYGMPHYIVRCGKNISTMPESDFFRLLKNESKID